MRPRARTCLAGLCIPAGLCLLVAVFPLATGAVEALEPTDAQRTHAARLGLEDARRFRRDGRLEAAERALRRGLAARPDDVRIHRELGGVLAELGRDSEAAATRARADALAPPPPPLSNAPLRRSSRGLMVVLLPPESGGEHPERVALGWPDGGAAETLEARLATRLPGATVVHAEPETVAAARAWLPRRAPRAVVSLRVERVFCGQTVKDGRFGLAWLRVAAALPGRDARSEVVREVLVDPQNPDPAQKPADPQLPDACQREVLARALESGLALPAVEAALAAPKPRNDAWSTQAIRGLFPGLGSRVETALTEGRLRLASGRLADATEAFQGAARIDPEDAVVRGYLHEVEATTAIAAEIARRAGEEETGFLDPRLSPAQAAAAQARLVEERRRRADLLTALAVLEEDVRAPPPESLRALREAPIHDPEAFGPDLARRRAGSEIEARTAFAPDGSFLARYYLPRSGGHPLLREEDTRGDGQVDRWIAYSDGLRREIWEDGRARGRPDIHLVFAGTGGAPLERIELDLDDDGQPDRVFHYDTGRLHAEARDTNGDGKLDRLDRFDAEGNVDLREEDLDGDGEMDLRSVYQAGKLVRRELSAPAAIPES